VSWEARLLSGLCVDPLQLGGLTGKQSTPSIWLGGTGVVSTVGKQQGNGAAQSSDVFEAGARQWYGLLFGSVECMLFTSAIISVTVLKRKDNGAASPFGCAFLPC